MNETELNAVRRAYAKQIMAAAGIEDPRLESALSHLRREDFLEPGPWQILRIPGGYRQTPSADPVYLYQDVLVAMMPNKGLNNGQPSFLVFLISLGRPREGDHAVHLGAGRGYYTAVVSRLVGNSGRVTAIEFEPELAARATENLSAYSNVRVMQGDGSTMSLEPADLIFVNAGAVRPADVWLDALKDGGRLILPLTVSFTTENGHAMTRGAVFLIEKQRAEYYANWASSTAIYPCAGARDEASAQALVAAFQKGGLEKVKRLYRSDDVSDDRCWVKGPGWAMAYD